MATLNERPDVHIASPITLRQTYQQPQKESRARSLRHVIVVTGPAGCGKSSVAEFLASAMGLPYIEGDNFHSASNIAKMSNGIPLTDDDRWDWLDTLRNKAVEELEGGAQGVVVTCSALKRKYRDIIRLAGQGAEDVIVRFVYLKANEKLLLNRVRARQNHYMKDDMVRSQFNALEEPDESEQDVLSVDVSQTLPQVQHAALEKIKQCLAEL